MKKGSIIILSILLTFSFLESVYAGGGSTFRVSVSIESLDNGYIEKKLSDFFKNFALHKAQYSDNDLNEIMYYKSLFERTSRYDRAIFERLRKKFYDSQEKIDAPRTSAGSLPLQFHSKLT